MHHWSFTSHPRCIIRFPTNIGRVEGPLGAPVAAALDNSWVVGPSLAILDFCCVLIQLECFSSLLCLLTFRRQNDVCAGFDSCRGRGERAVGQWVTDSRQALMETQPAQMQRVDFLAQPSFTGFLNYLDILWGMKMKTLAFEFAHHFSVNWLPFGQTVIITRETWEIKRSENPKESIS